MNAVACKENDNGLYCLAGLVIDGRIKLRRRYW